MDFNSQRGFIVASDYMLDSAFIVANVPYNSPGFPSYRCDDRLISFGASPLHGGGGVDSIFNVALAANSLTPVGEPVGFVPSGIYPIWFRTGSRPTPVESLPLPLPTTVELAQNFPNPFNPSTMITYSLPETMPVRVTIHDAMGRTVKTLASETAAAGRHSARWDGTDERGQSCPSGVYLLRLAAGSNTLSRTMIMVK